jgi:hypothetical protein
MTDIMEYGDCFVGILVGAVFIGLSGLYFDVPNIALLWGAVFAGSFAFTLLDLRNTFKDLKDHPVMLIVLLLNNIADAAIELGAAVFMLGFSLPYISELLNPYLSTPSGLFILGAFFIASSVFWLFEFVVKNK